MKIDPFTLAANMLVSHRLPYARIEVALKAMGAEFERLAAEEVGYEATGAGQTNALVLLEKQMRAIADFKQIVDSVYSDGMSALNSLHLSRLHAD